MVLYHTSSVLYNTTSVLYHTKSVLYHAIEYRFSILLQSTNLV
jgi:hypothetical protein